MQIFHHCHSSNKFQFLIPEPLKCLFVDTITNVQNAHKITNFMYGEANVFNLIFFSSFSFLCLFSLSHPMMMIIIKIYLILLNMLFRDINFRQKLNMTHELAFISMPFYFASCFFLTFFLPFHSHSILPFQSTGDYGATKCREIYSRSFGDFYHSK